MKNNGKNLFGDAISPLIHDIRNPLNIIMGFASILQLDDNLDEETKSHISKISFSAKQIENLLANIDYCMIEELPYKNKSLSVSREIDRFRKKMDNLISEKGVVFSVKVDDSTQIHLADEVFSNIMLNLLHFSVKGMRSLKEKPVYISSFNEAGKRVLLYCDKSDYFPISGSFFSFEEILNAKRGLYPLFIQNLTNKFGGTVEYCNKEKLDSLVNIGESAKEAGQGFLFTFPQP